MVNPTALQIFFGLLTVVSALTVVIQKNPVVCAVMLMSTLFCTGALYFGLGSYFIGAVQILIYAGAISVLFVFVVMLLDLRPFFLKIPGRRPKIVAGCVAGILMLLALCLCVLPGSALQASSNPALEGALTPRVISLDFLSKYMLPYQVTGLLILVSVLGVVILGRPLMNAATLPSGDKK